MKKILLFVLWGVVCTNGIYAHSKVQQSVVETSAINIPAAWDITTGNP